MVFICSIVNKTCLLCVMPPFQLHSASQGGHSAIYPVGLTPKETLVPEYSFTIRDYVFPFKKEMFNWTNSLHVVNMFCHITFLMQLLKILTDSAELHLVLGVLNL